MQHLEIHRRYFDLKMLLVLIFVIITIFAATRSGAGNIPPRHTYFSEGIRGVVSVSLDGSFNGSGHLTAGIQGSLLYHPSKINKFYFGVGQGYDFPGLRDTEQSFSEPRT